MITALIITNIVFNIFFSITLGFVCYGVIKKKKVKQPQKPNYIRK